LTTEEEQHHKAQNLRFQDKINNGMSQKEVLTLIVDWTGRGSFNTAENHFEYLVRNGKMSQLKNGSRVVMSQQNYHCLIEGIWEEQNRLNLPSVLWNLIRADFICNVDEASVMASEGKIKIIGDAEWNEHQKTMDDNRNSITIVKVGNAGSTSGPLFLAKGEK
jgi:hypothetical protein